MAGFFERLARRFGYVKAGELKRRFEAAQRNRLTADWILSATTVDRDLHRDLSLMRTRSRDLSYNNAYYRKFLAMVRKNVPGPRGIRLQMDVRNDDGTRDVPANRMLERAFGRWGRRGVCTVDGERSWPEVQETIVHQAARDGEIFVRKVVGFDNEFRFALQLIDAELCDHEVNVSAAPGRNEIRLGIEYDAWRRPVAYHMLTHNPGDYPYSAAPSGQGRHVRVPASEIVHYAYREGARQARGVPLLVAAVMNLKMVGGYKEAALVAARAGASKMGFFEEETPEEMPKAKTAEGDLIDEASPGHFERLPPGVKFTQWDPAYPQGDFDPFVKALLKGVASAGDVSYNALASDLEGVNYSSLRAGLGEERDAWRMLQGHQARGLNGPIFDAWLPLGLTTVNLPSSRIEKFRAATWQPRGWAGVDPLKEAGAHAIELRSGTTTRTRILAQRGYDLEETFEEIKREQDLAEELGLELQGVDSDLLLGGLVGQQDEEAEQ